ncbi:MAG: carboxypeptidase regulatory-like domain-containing protein [Acidobacteriota bacterium]
MLLDSRDARRLTLLSCFFLLTGLALATAASAQDWKGRARVQGLVTDENGQPVVGATVTLRRGDADGPGPDALTTNKKGRWSFLGLTGGPWNVTIEHPGYDVSEGTMPVTEAGTNDLVRTQLDLAGAAAAAEDPAVAAANAAASAASDALTRAGSLLSEGKGAEARAAMAEAMESLDAARHPQILLSIAKSHFQDGNTADAISTLEKGLAIAPEDPESLKLISSILVNEGRQEEANAYIAKLPEGAKVDPNALLNQGIQKYNGNDLDGALADFDAIVADYPDNADAYYYRGLVNMGKGLLDPAKADFQKMLDLAPDHANAGEAKQFLEYLSSQ